MWSKLTGLPRKGKKRKCQEKNIKDFKYFLTGSGWLYIYMYDRGAKLRSVEKQLELCGQTAGLEPATSTGFQVRRPNPPNVDFIFRSASILISA